MTNLGNFSNNRANSEVTLVGRQFLALLKEGFLGRGVIKAFFHLRGTSPRTRLKL